MNDLSSGMYASFLKGKGHKGMFPLVKGTLLGKMNISTGAFQGHDGNGQGARLQ